MDMRKLLGAFDITKCECCKKEEKDYSEYELEYHSPREYNKEIPINGLKALKSAVKSKLFDKINIVTSKKRQRTQVDPLLVGWIERQKFLIGKWL